MGDESGPNDLTCVYQAANVSAAHVVRNLLLGAGIVAEISERAQLAGDYSCDVNVRLADKAQALATIEQATP